MGILAYLTPIPAFRIELLHFIRLAANYTASIFIECRSRAQPKHRHQFAEWLAQNEQDKDKQLWLGLRTRARWFDALKQDFTYVIREMPIPLQTRLERAIQHDHLLPWDLRRFERALDDLREYRHWLEHYDERVRSGRVCPCTDERLVELLGLLLLPHLNNHLLGRMRYHARRAGFRGTPAAIPAAKAIMDKSVADRREASREINGLKRRIDADTIRDRITRKYGNPPGDQAVHRIAREEAKKRRDLETRKRALLTLHGEYFDPQTWPRYNLENFLIRFAFIGKGRIAELEALLGEAKGGGRHNFITAVEPAFELALDIALIFHDYLTELEIAGVPIRKRAKVGPAVTGLRNAIAHGDWFWRVPDPARNDVPFTFDEIIERLAALPGDFGLAGPAQWRNNLLTRLESCLRDRKRTLAYRIPQPGDDPNRNPSPIKVARWTDAARERFADRKTWRIERSPALRSLAARWKREIAAARKNLAQ